MVDEDLFRALNRRDTDSGISSRTSNMNSLIMTFVVENFTAT